MIGKASLVLVALAGGAFVGGAASRIVYSALQVSYPIGAAFKMTPDPANVWSWHEETALLPNTMTSLPVVVDFDSDGRMDTEDPNFRVLVTDMQAAFTEPFYNQFPPHVTLKDSQGVRWDLSPSRSPGGIAWSMDSASFHLTTPIVLPVGSSLTVEIDTTNVGPPGLLRINLVGRVVNL